MSLILSSDDEDNLKSAKAKGVTWKEFIPDISVEKADNNQIILKSPKEGTTAIYLIAFGDFNNDGIEDTLVFVSHYVSEGSFRSFGMKILTKKQKDGKILAEDVPK